MESHTEHDAFDEAARTARSRIQHGGGWSAWLIVVLIGVAGAAFFGGWRFAHLRSASHATANAHAHDELWTCSMHPQVIEKKPGICPICHMELTPLKAGGASDQAVTIDPVVVQNMGIRTAVVKREPIMQSVRVVGYLEEPDPLQRDVNLRVSGWIEKLYADTEGIAVKKGQPLFDLYSPELTVAIDELIAARKQAERAPNDAVTKNLLESARRKLLQYGIESEQIDTLASRDTAPGTVPILSPIDGHVTAKMVYQGAAVKAGDLVLRLASRHRIWIDAQVHEQQMPLVSDGQPVRATVISQPGRTFTGKVLFIHPHVDPQTRTALVRIEIDNQDLSLRQGMYATVEIRADAYREAPVVPREAVIDTGKRQIVFVALGEGRFELREVTLGLPSHDGSLEVLAGVQEGETIVTSGQFLLDSESRLKEAISKQLSASLASAAPAPKPARIAATPASQPSERIAVPHAKEIVEAYLALSEQLGARQTSNAPLDPQRLLDVAEQAVKHAQGDAKSLATAVRDAAAQMANKTLPEQRQAFVALSEAAIELAQRADISTSSKPLFVMHCPMVFDDKGARWLQKTEQIANPYYATEMKRCGEVVERIEP